MFEFVAINNENDRRTEPKKEDKPSKQNKDFDEFEDEEDIIEYDQDREDLQQSIKDAEAAAEELEQ